MDGKLPLPHLLHGDLHPQEQGLVQVQSLPSQPGDISFEGAQLPEVAKSGRKPGYYTFLLVGKDTSSGLTDTMMLITTSGSLTQERRNRYREIIKTATTTSA